MTRPEPRITRHDGLVEAVFEDVSIVWQPAPGLAGVELGWAKGEIPEQRVSAEELQKVCGLAEHLLMLSSFTDPQVSLGHELALDLRDARTALAQSPDRIVGVRWRDDGYRRGLERAAEMLEETAASQDHDCSCLDNQQSPPECSLIANGRDCLCSYASEVMLAEAARLRKEAAR